jgi:hypothetical protein
MMKARPVGAIGALMVAAALIWQPAAQAEPVVQQSGNISYVTGGVGLEERAALAQQTSDFNLKVVNAVPGRPFVADVDIAVKDSRGQELLRTTTDGPWLLAKLPAGRYTIHASDGNRTQTRTVQLGQSQREVMLRWPDTSTPTPMAGGSGSVGAEPVVVPSGTQPVAVPRQY